MDWTHFRILARYEVRTPDFSSHVYVVSNQSRAVGFAVWQGICYNNCMPYKNIEDRREAWRRWRDRHPEQRRAYVAIQKQATYANPVRKCCQVSNCKEIGERHHPDYSKPKDIIWLCKRHHELIHSTVHCSIDDCTNRHLARGMCQKHYSAWRRSK